VTTREITAGMKISVRNTTPPCQPLLSRTASNSGRAVCRTVVTPVKRNVLTSAFQKAGSSAITRKFCRPTKSGEPSPDQLVRLR
jgi:hypothetical protein